MAFPEDLIEQAQHLAKRETKKPKQASLRRAVSTAYYALFHLLISEATLNWRRAEQRSALARHFEHGRMKAASDKQRAECNRLSKANARSSSARELHSIRQLYNVANTFFEAQQARHLADYDNSRRWTRTQVLILIDKVEGAFESWQLIRDEPAAQAYLISLLGRPQA